MRKLSPEEETLWARVMASVRPLDAERVAIRTAAVENPAPPGPGRRAAPSPPPPLTRRAAPGTSLDGGWDRRLARGDVSPDRVVDLHGHNLAQAYDLLDSSLSRAIDRGERLILLVTGRPPRGEPPIARGRIRAAIGDWLAASPHAVHIAAVRGAHPRHGGAGALYIILRRRRSPKTK